MGGWNKKKNLPPSNFFMLRHHKKFQPSCSKRSKICPGTDTHRRHPPCRIIVRTKKICPPVSFLCYSTTKNFSPLAQSIQKLPSSKVCPGTDTQTHRRHPPCRIIVRHGIVNSSRTKKTNQKNINVFCLLPTDHCKSPSSVEVS